jgi:UDP-2,4-diacetamido-2,4,6-trideoxy-beta-L-altropyranose hydrolase
MMTRTLGYKIAFINEASSLIGMGHILRSQALARGMYARGYSITGVTIGDKKAVSYAKQRTKYENFKWPIQTVQDYQLAIKIIMHIAPSLVVVDCNMSGQHIVVACKKLGIPVLALDYFSSEQPLPDLVINLIDHDADSLSGHPPSRKGSAYYEGPEYAIIRDEFSSAREYRISRMEPVLPKKIVIAFGGADPSGNTKRALNIIAQWPSKFLVDLIIGPLFTFEIKSITSNFENCNITIHKSPNYMNKLFELADLVFCGGGGTLLEATYVGVPAIVIAQNAAEQRHANSLSNRRACWISEDIDWETVGSKENRNERSNYSRDCVDGLGSIRICDLIEQQLYKI